MALTLARAGTTAPDCAKAGSIGSAAPHFDERNSRVKGFSARPVATRKGLDRAFSEISGVESAHPKSTRTTLRAFVRRELVEGLRGDTGLPYAVEAVVPAGRALPGYSMVYFGRNSASRMPDPAVFAAEGESVRLISREAPLGRDAALIKPREAGYSISRLEKAGDADLARMLRLYREAYQLYTFDINETTMRDMLNNGNIVLVGRNGSGEIASALIAEHCALELEGRGRVHIYELSDYATFPGDRGKGLITAMQVEIARMLGNVHREEGVIIYAEDRAAWKAVNMSSVRAGMRYCGTLPLHCLLVSERDFDSGSQYESLNVFAVPDGSD